MIEVKNLKKSFGEIEALRGVSFSVAKGEILGFLGPNGAGKTTTLKIMTCYLPPSSGSVTIGGLEVQEHGLEVRRKFGYMPENAPIYGDMLVYDYLSYMASIRGVPSARREERVRRVVEQCGLGDVAGQVSGTLSKGYRQRVCLAQALVHDPEILILDEPTVGLDPNQIVEIRGLIRSLGQERTVIISSHILPEVLATCSRMVIINRGRVVADGTPEELEAKHSPGTEYHLRLRSTVPGQEPDKLKADLATLPSVRRVEEGRRSGGGELELLLHTDGGADLREVILNAAKSRGWPLLEIHKERLELERIFHKLTQE